MMRALAWDVSLGGIGMGSAGSHYADMPQARDDERAVATISARRWQRWWGGLECVLLYFTERRVIVARTAYASFWWSVLGPWAYLFAALREGGVSKRLAAMPADAVLAADSHNLQIGYPEIVSVELKASPALRSGQINILTQSTRYRFTATGWRQPGQDRAVLRGVLGERLRVV